MISIALLIFPLTTIACVDTRSGNFCTNYSDISQKSGDHELNLTRTYNSKSTETGWFGYGWGTSFEQRLLVMPDGSAVVHDLSTQKNERYSMQDKDVLQSGVEKIVAVVVGKDGLGVEAASELRSKLLLSEELRISKVREYAIKTQLADGVKLHSTECSKASISRNRDEYQRIKCSKGVDYFDLAGRLIRQEDENYKVVIHYAGDHPDRISDSLGQELSLTWDATGHLVEAKSKQDAPAIKYRYDEKNNLVFSSEAEGNDAAYVYDDKHKLTGVGFINQSHIELKYDEAGRIKELNDSNAPKMSYSYRKDPEYPSLHHWTTATTTNEEGKQTIRLAEYFSTLDTAGVERLSRVFKTDAHGKEEIVLDEKERFKRIVRADGSFTEISYHPTLGKVSVVSTNEGKTDFSYDKQGNMIRASTGKGHLVSLSYDRHNSIVRMVESDQAKHTRHELLFKYNAQKKPIQISMVGKGEINVTYDKLGEILNVNSKQGAKMALEVTQAFQGLLTLVKVASVDYCL
jgi:YD repeat-containing protein